MQAEYFAKRDGQRKKQHDEAGPSTMKIEDDVGPLTIVLEDDDINWDDLEHESDD